MTKINDWLPLGAKQLPELFIMKGLSNRKLDGLQILNETEARRWEHTCERGMRLQGSHGYFRERRKEETGVGQDTLKNSTLSPNKTLKWQGNIYRFFSQSIHTSTRNNWFQRLSLPVGELLELFHVPEEADRSRNARVSRAQQRAYPVSGRTQL